MDTNFNTGLSETEVQYKLKEYGLNKISVAKKNTFLKMLFSQFTSLIIISVSV